MICPHCGIGTSPNWRSEQIGSHGVANVVARCGDCTECDGLIVIADFHHRFQRGTRVRNPLLLFPPGPQVRPIPPEVDAAYADDFREASRVLPYSAKASAALSRRLLQRIIHEKAGIRDRNLDKEIDAVIEQKDVSSGLAADLDMIRTIGNFAAHPIKSEHTGEVVDVEPGEAEALLDLVTDLFDHYFVKPAQRTQRREALNAKLAETGKPELKRAVEALAELPGPDDQEPPRVLS